MKRNPIFITFGLLSAFVLIGCEEEAPRVEQVRPVLAMKIQDAAGLNGQWVPGRAKATQEVDLSFEVPGKIIDRPVFVGDEVTKGQIMAQLDPRDYENDLERASAERDRHKAQFQRVEQAAKTGAIAKQEVDNARARLTGAEAEVRIRQKALDDATIHTPYDGTVSWIYKEKFEDVREKEPVVRVVDTSRIEFVIQLPETEISLIPHVVNIRVKFDAFPDDQGSPRHDRQGHG
jgi:RND family efflux transporter MFP subunit